MSLMKMARAMRARTTYADSNEMIQKGRMRVLGASAYCFLRLHLHQKLGQCWIMVPGKSIGETWSPAESA